MDSLDAMQVSMPLQVSEEVKFSSDDLIARARSGDPEILGQIFKMHHRFIYKFIYAMLGQHSLAEELTQETFLGAFKGIKSLRGEAQLRTWLCGIAKNLVYKSFRSNRGESYRADTAIETLGLPDTTSRTPVEQMVNKELNRVIARALSNLDEDRRSVFILKEIQHLSYNEIADITGCTIPKLKTDLHRAKLEMRQALRLNWQPAGGLK